MCNFCVSLSHNVAISGVAVRVMQERGVGGWDLNPGSRAERMYEGGTHAGEEIECPQAALGNPG